MRRNSDIMGNGVLAALIVSCLVVVIVLWSGLANAQTTNLALKQPVVASSVGPESPPLIATNAVDGSLSTRWASARTDKEWIYVDLGQAYNLTRVKITWEAAYGKAYTIDVSNDAQAWATISTTSNNTTLVNDYSVTGTGRYVRMTGIARGTGYGYSIFELEAYGTPVVVAPPPLPPPPPYVAIPTDCLPKQLLGTGTFAKWDTVSPRGGNPLVNDAVIVYYCNDGWSWTRWNYAGVLSDHIAALNPALSAAMFGNPQPLLALSGKTTQPLTADEQAVSDDLAREIRHPPLWIVQSNGNVSTRPVFQHNADGTIGAQEGLVIIGQECNCSDATLRVQTDIATYCSVAGLLAAGSSTQLPADAMAVCIRP